MGNRKNIRFKDSTNLSRELSSLEKAGILSSTREGNLKYFHAHKNCAFYVTCDYKGFLTKKRKGGFLKAKTSIRQ